LIATAALRVPVTEWHDAQITCARLLLNVGADPTIGTICDGEEGSAISLWLQSEHAPSSVSARKLYSGANLDRTQDAFRVALDIGWLFIGAQSVLEDGLGLWLQACREINEESVDNLHSLLRTGVDIAETGGPNKWNCLFYCVLDAIPSASSHQGDVLGFLLPRFPEIYATDASGKSIFDHVNEDISGPLGSYRRDFWYDALRKADMTRNEIAIEHHDVVMRIQPWVQRFTERYTPLMFHALHWNCSWEENDSALWPQIKDILMECTCSTQAEYMKGLMEEHPSIEFWVSEVGLECCRTVEGCKTAKYGCLQQVHLDMLDCKICAPQQDRSDTRSISSVHSIDQESCVDQPWQQSVNS
jgi:hypothetical protein